MTGLDAPVVCSDSVIAEHVETYHSSSVQVADTAYKGRVLLAARDFEAGERVLLEYPLVEVAVDTAVPAYVALLQLRDDGALELPPFFYWAALSSLTTSQVACASYPAWAAVSVQTQAQVLELHAPPEAYKVASWSTAAVIGKLWTPGAGPDPLLLEHLLQVWIYNSFDQGRSDDALEAGVLFLVASMCSHSCSPNAAWHLDDSNSFILHARQPIDEAQELTIPYLGPADLCLPTPDRRQILEVTKAFVCQCERCAVPLDTMRAFRCPLCSGTALPRTCLELHTDCTDLADHFDDWALNCRACGNLPAAQSRELLEAEARLRPRVRVWGEFHNIGEETAPVSVCEGTAADEDAHSVSLLSALDLLNEAKIVGLSDEHWIVDVLRAMAVEEVAQTGAAQVTNSGRAPGDETDSGNICRCALLRDRVVAHRTAGPHAATKCARLNLELGSALCERGSAEALREAVQAYGDASETLALLFGDDHPEYQEAVALQQKAARRLAAVPTKAMSSNVSCAPVQASAAAGRGRKKKGAKR